MPDNSFFDRDLSWLSFNYRVMIEAARETTPLLERVNFLSIYSSNLDEFYRVRVPTLAALQKIKKSKETVAGAGSAALLQKITHEVGRQLVHYGQLLTGRVLPDLFLQGIDLLYEQAAMGIAVGYFAAADDAKMAALRRNPKMSHDMAGMSHDH